MLAPIKVLIADDHSVVRRGLKEILEETRDIVVKGEASNADEVLEQVRRGGWDAVVLDITMPGRSGLDLLKDLRLESPHLPVLILSMHSEDQYAFRVLKAGAAGYLTKETAPDELVKAIRKVVAGGKYISPALAEKLAQQIGSDFSLPPHQSLSDRELEVLRMIASGKAPMQIANELGLSIKTVSTYRTRILEKMNFKTNAELMHYAIKTGLVQ